MTDLSNRVLGRTIAQWRAAYPLLTPIQELREVCWLNPGLLPYAQTAAGCPLSMKDMEEADARLRRFAPYIQIAFPETAAANGVIESPLCAIPAMQKLLEKEHPIPGRLMLKCDHMLPISGSIKARGGIYEVLYTAEKIALREGLLQSGEDYSIFDSERFRRVFSHYSIAVGSTGNLGLSIGVMGAKLGFRTTVHMSADARQWKKDMLRSKGVEVREYASDYTLAVAEGRKAASADPFCHFVDDENSQTLFLGYAAAALRLKKQFEEQQITVDQSHPLFVYLPCGVGGGPGGVAFGLKQIYGDNVHCFFAEPTHSCSMLLGLMTGENHRVSVQDFGIDNRTAADGLAVGRASGFVGSLMAPFISGCYTVTDENMFRLMAQLSDSENIRLEPSALAGMAGPLACSDYLQRKDLKKAAEAGIQLVWATGGSMVPISEMQNYYRRGSEFLGRR